MKSSSRVDFILDRLFTENRENVTEIVRLRGIEKDFSGVKALRGVSLTARAGEVLALVGENGAGKSTLMKVLGGIYPVGQYEGEIAIANQVVGFQSPRDAESAGIAMIHQELSVFAHLSVMENLTVGQWPAGRFGRILWKEMESKAQKLLAEFGVSIPMHRQMSELSVGEQQMIEIAKAVSRKSRALILDEPTSALTPHETEKLFAVIEKLKRQGCALIYISHKLDELERIANRYLVLRDGRSVWEAEASEVTRPKLITQMVGRELTELFPSRGSRKVTEVVLRAKNVSAVDRQGQSVIEPFSFELRKGEILGIAGLLGAGRTELVRTLLGDIAVKRRGDLMIRGRCLATRNPQEGIRAGFAYVSEDRKRESILPGRSISENIFLTQWGQQALSSRDSMKKNDERAMEWIRKLKIKCTGPGQEIQTLSGGNQQKVILARSLQTQPQILILDEPTRGVDVGSKYEIYEILFELADQGLGLIVVSSELPELIGICDRIAVLSEKKWMGEINHESFSQSKIMELAFRSAN